MPVDIVVNDLPGNCYTMNPSAGANLFMYALAEAGEF